MCLTQNLQPIQETTPSNSNEVKVIKTKFQDDELIFHRYILDSLTIWLYDLYRSMNSINEIWIALETKVYKQDERYKQISKFKIL